MDEESKFRPYTMLVRLLIVPLLRRVLNRFVQSGHLTVQVSATGDQLTFGDQKKRQPVHMTIWHPVSLLCRMALDPRMGLGEGFVAGDWSVQPSLQVFFQLLIDNRLARTATVRSHTLPARMVYRLTRFIGWLINYIWHALRPNTLAGSRQNIKQHYDLGNDMFQLFLDQSMTYSCGFFNEPEDTLHDAQMNKLDAIIDKLQLKNTDHVLEIGFGWGSCAIRAVQKTGCQWTGLTISEQQLHMAKERVAQLGLQDRIQLKFLDYRLEKGEYDKVVAIEMIEAVGHGYLPTFFQIIRDRLKPHGQAAIQSITIPDAQYDKYMRSSDFIRKHIFPGGHLPCLAAIRQALPVDLQWRQTSYHGKHYATTLDQWDESWLKKENQVVQLGYGENFFRKWHYYFCLCSALFANQHIDVVQILLQKDD